MSAGELLVGGTDLPLLLRVTEAARYAGVSEHHARELIASGTWAHLRRGRRILVVRRSVEAWADAIDQGR